MLQIILFLIFLLMEEGSLSNLFSSLTKHIFNDYKSTFKMALPPAFLILSTEFANEMLPNEAKSANSFYIVGVAIFCLLLIKKKFMLTQILAILFISMGLTYFPQEHQIMSTLLPNIFKDQELFAYILIIASICCYGLSYAILESNLKASDVSLWIRGIQLNLFVVPMSLFICFGNYYINDMETRGGFFDNFNIIAWFFIIFIVACNMMELFVIKVADSMFRMIALSLAVMIIGIMKYPFSFDSASPTKVGTGLILAGTALYILMDVGSFKEGDEGGMRDIQSYIIPMKLYQSVPTVSFNVKNNIQNIES
ncbi:hypothetical protein ACKWTF_004333 [Chironomus riparius]